jgi:hypothetical protein
MRRSSDSSFAATGVSSCRLPHCGDRSARSRAEVQSGGKVYDSHQAGVGGRRSRHACHVHLRDGRDGRHHHRGGHRQRQSVSPGGSSAGGVSFAASLQINRDPANEITKVRGAGRITKLSKASAVQVDSLRLGTSTTAVVVNNTPVNSGTASQALSYTAWHAVAPRTCTPKHHESDATVHRGRITKQGSVLVRWAAIEAAQCAGKHTRTGRRRDQIGQRRGRNVGVTAAARDLIGLVYYALRDGQVRCLQPRPTA